MPYLPEDEPLVYRYGLSTFSAQLDVQVGADAVTHDAAGRFPRVVADLAVRRVFEKLWEQTKTTAKNQSMHSTSCL